MTCLQGSLAHRYTYSSLRELNLTDTFFFPKVSCERVYLPSSCSALVGCGWSLLGVIHAETMDFLPLRAAHPHMATTQARQTWQTSTHMCRAARMKHFGQLHFERLWRSCWKCPSLLRCWECFIKMKYQSNGWRAFTASATRNWNTESMFPGSDHSCKKDATKIKFQRFAFWANGSWEKWTGCSKWFLEHFQLLCHRWVLRLYAYCWVRRNCAKAPARKLSQDSFQTSWYVWNDKSMLESALCLLRFLFQTNRCTYFDASLMHPILLREPGDEMSLKL